VRKKQINTGHQRPAENMKIDVLLLPAFNIRDVHHTLVAAVHIRCFAGGIVVVVAVAVVAAAAEAEAGCMAASAAAAAAEAADIAVAAASAEAGCTAAFSAAAAAEAADIAVAASAEAGCCTDLRVLAVPDWMNHHRCGFVRRHFVLRNVVGPREPVGFLRGRVSAGRGWATKS
jgi:hypothetical protein